MSKLENKPSEKIKAKFREILENPEIVAEYVPEKYVWAMCQAIVAYLDDVAESGEKWREKRNRA